MYRRAAGGGRRRSLDVLGTGEDSIGASIANEVVLPLQYKEIGKSFECLRLGDAHTPATRHYIWFLVDLNPPYTGF